MVAGRARMRPLVALLRRDLRLAWRRGADSLQGLLFFLVALALFPLGVGPSPDILSRIGPGVILVLALLAVLLTLDRLFQADAEDGSLDILALSPLPLEAVAALKALAHWLTTGLPLLLAAPLLGVTLGLAPAATPWLAAALLAGTPALSFLGAIGAAVTVGVRRGGLLLSILVLPLYVPSLILGARTVAEAAEGGDPVTPFFLLAGLTLCILAGAPFAAAAALRVNLR
jgi:heme exporter protein B